MGRYLIRRVLQFIPVFVGATFLIYFMVFAMPGDPIRAFGGEKPLSPATYEAMRERYNLNEPFWKQYLLYVEGILPIPPIPGVYGGSPDIDLGTNFAGRPVSEIMKDRFPVTVKLALGAFIFEVILGITAGVLAGLRRGSFVDNLVLVATTAVISVPIFVLGYIAQIVLGLKFEIFPIAGLRNGWFSYALPSMVLGSVSLAYVARLTRTSLVENLRADYVRTATAKGLRRRRVIGLHALRNSLIPVITYLGVDIGALMGGAIITETIFNLPGIGREVYESVRAQEGAVVVGIVTALVLIFMLSNLLVDLFYAVLDPRIRYE